MVTIFSVMDTEEKKELFYTICSDSDFNMLIGKEQMDYGDFLRILYILNWLGFDELEFDVFNEFGDKFCDRVILDSLPPSDNIEIADYTKWIWEFCHKIPILSIRRYYMKKLVLQ